MVTSPQLSARKANQIFLHSERFISPVHHREIRAYHEVVREHFAVAVAALKRAHSAFVELKQDSFQVKSLEILHQERIRRDLTDCRKALRAVEKILKAEGEDHGDSPLFQSISDSVKSLRRTERALYRTIRNKKAKPQDPNTVIQDDAPPLLTDAILPVPQQNTAIPVGIPQLIDTTKNLGNPFEKAIPAAPPPEPRSATKRALLYITSMIGAICLYIFGSHEKSDSGLTEKGSVQSSNLAMSAIQPHEEPAPRGIITESPETNIATTVTTAYPASVPEESPKVESTMPLTVPLQLENKNKTVTPQEVAASLSPAPITATNPPPKIEKNPTEPEILKSPPLSQVLPLFPKVIWANYYTTTNEESEGNWISIGSAILSASSSKSTIDTAVLPGPGNVAGIESLSPAANMIRAGVLPSRSPLQIFGGASGYGDSLLNYRSTILSRAINVTVGSTPEEGHFAHLGAEIYSTGTLLSGASAYVGALASLDQSGQTVPIAEARGKHTLNLDDGAALSIEGSLGYFPVRTEDQSSNEQGPLNFRTFQDIKPFRPDLTYSYAAQFSSAPQLVGGGQGQYSYVVGSASSGTGAHFDALTHVYAGVEGGLTAIAKPTIPFDVDTSWGYFIDCDDAFNPEHDFWPGFRAKFSASGRYKYTYFLAAVEGGIYPHGNSFASKARLSISQRLFPKSFPMTLTCEAQWTLTEGTRSEGEANNIGFRPEKSRVAVFLSKTF